MINDLGYLVDNLKNVLKILGRGWVGEHPAVLVASPGRSGSTVLYDAVAVGLDSRVWTVRANAWNIEKTHFWPSFVYKTHGQFSDVPDAVKVLYIYREASEIVESTIRCAESFGLSWYQRHCRHLGLNNVTNLDPDALKSSDIMQIGENLESWIKNGSNCCFVKYDALWESIEGINNFLGFNVCLPEFKRSSSVTQISGYDKYNDLYESLPEVMFQ